MVVKGNKKFIRRETDILEPDIIISENIGYILVQCLARKSFCFIFAAKGVLFF